MHLICEIFDLFDLMESRIQKLLLVRLPFYLLDSFLDKSSHGVFDPPAYDQTGIFVC